MVIMPQNFLSLILLHICASNKNKVIHLKRHMNIFNFIRSLRAGSYH